MGATEIDFTPLHPFRRHAELAIRSIAFHTPSPGLPSAKSTDLSAGIQTTNLDPRREA